VCCCCHPTEGTLGGTGLGVFHHFNARSRVGAFYSCSVTLISWRPRANGAGSCTVTVKLNLRGRQPFPLVSKKALMVLISEDK
jgi:hypothetical protein